MRSMVRGACGSSCRWRSETTKTGASSYTVNEEEQAHGVSGMERSEHRPERNEVKWRRARWDVISHENPRMESFGKEA